MNTPQQQPPERTKTARIERLRTRVKEQQKLDRHNPVYGIVLGVLDLLEDEL